MGVKYTNNINQFQSLFDRKKLQAHQSMADIGEQGINANTPVSSGVLKSNNESEGREDAAYWWNDTPYAPFVHYGTYKMNANPFIVRGVMQKIPEMLRSIVRILKV